MLARNRIEVAGVSRYSDKFIKCDLTDFQSVKKMVKEVGCDTIIHCAANVPKSIDEYNSERVANDNLLMVKNIVANSPKQILAISSMTVYPNDIKMPAKEEYAGGSLKRYANAKYKAEQILMKSKNLESVIILRLPGLFGPPRRSGLLYNVAMSFATGNDPKISNIPMSWAAMHIDDAAEICVKAAQNFVKKRLIVNVGYEGTFSINMAVSLIADIFGKKTKQSNGNNEFSMDLSLLKREFGLPRYTFEERVVEIVHWVKQDVSK